MSLSIEDILRGHGIGSGGGLNIVESTTEPTTGLSPGLFWYNPEKDETKMYLNGEFKNIGGGSVITPFFGQTRTTSVTNEVIIDVEHYVPSKDTLLVSQNGTVITESVDYTIDKKQKVIRKVTGNWQENTVFGFTALASTPTSNSDNITLVRLEHNVRVASGVNQISFYIPGYNPDFDLLSVHQRNLEIFKGIDWTLNPDGTSITLTYTLDAPEDFHFTVLKKIRDTVPDGTIDGSMIIPGTVGESALGFGVVRQADLDAHVSADMPHEFVDEGVRYRWGFRTLNGQPQFIYEEVNE